MTPYASLLLRLAAALCCLLLCAPAHAQTVETAHTLLWKITAPHLPAPSYLYGTMHVQDERAFGFSDSVLVKLRECPAFAMELLPDSAITVIFRELFSPDTGVSIREYMNEEDYNRLSKRLTEELGFSATSVNTSKPWVLRSYLNTTDRNFRKDRSTFVDGYLYRLARQFGSEIIALETVEEQMRNDWAAPMETQARDLLSMLDDSTMTVGTTVADSLLLLYQQGRLADIETLIAVHSDTTDPTMNDLIPRNYRMVERLLPHMERLPVFIAVGAAHLPGREGIIGLLRARGYTVTPVPATFTGVAETITTQPLRDPWYTHALGNTGFQVDMPIVPVTAPVQSESIPLTMAVTADLGTGLGYIAAHAQLPLFVPNNLAGALLDSVASAMRDDSSATIEHFTLNGLSGVRFTNVSDEQTMHVRLFVHRDRLLMFMTTGDTATSPDTERFFSSIAWTELPAATAPQSFSSAEGAFAIDFPTEPKREETDTDLDAGRMMTTVLYLAPAPDNNVVYYAGYYRYPTGITAQSMSTMAPVAFESMAVSMQGELGELRDTLWEGFAATDGEIIGADFRMRIRMILRGSRPYIVMALADHDHIDIPEIDDFFASFRFLPFPPTVWSDYRSDGHAFSVPLPGTPVVTSDTALHIQTSYIADDRSTGLNYVVQVREYSPYAEMTRVTSDSALFEQLRENYTDHTDSLVAYAQIVVDGNPACDFTLASTEDSRPYRIRLVLRGRTLYTLMLQAPADWLQQPDNERFFSAFTLLPAPDGGSLFADATERLLRDLTSPDSTVAEQARQAVGVHPFAQQDLRGIYSALDHSYSDDAEILGVRSALLDVLETTNDAETPSFLRTLFPSLTAYPLLQQQALRTLAAMHTEQSLTTFTDLAVGGDVSDEMWALPLYYVSTSTATCRVMFPRILSMIDQETYRAELYTFLQRALDNGIVSGQELAPISSRLLHLCRNDYDHLQTARAEQSDDEYNVASLLESTAPVLGYLGGDSALAMLQILAADTAGSLAMEASLALAHSGRAPGVERWQQIAANPMLRGTLYERLEQMHHGALFPAAFRTQEALAEADLTTTVVYFLEETPEEMHMLQEHEVPDGDRAGRYFVFRYRTSYSNEEDERVEIWRVGISGPHPLDRTQLIVSGEATTVSEHDYEAMSIDEHIASFFNTHY